MAATLPADGGGGGDAAPPNVADAGVLMGTDGDGDTKPATTTTGTRVP
jgi:hypothetical protein